MKINSTLLNICSSFTIFTAGLTLFLPFYHGFNSQEWGMAWCNSQSSTLHWVTLYLWAATIIPICYYMFKNVLKMYRWVIISYCLFWTFAFLFSNGNHEGILLIFGFLYLMRRSYKKVEKSIDYFIKAQHLLEKQS